MVQEYYKNTSGLMNGVGGCASPGGLSLNIQLLHLDQARIPMYRRAVNWLASVGLGYVQARRLKNV